MHIVDRTIVQGHMPFIHFFELIQGINVQTSGNIQIKKKIGFFLSLLHDTKKYFNSTTIVTLFDNEIPAQSQGQKIYKIKKNNLKISVPSLFSLSFCKQQERNTQKRNYHKFSRNIYSRDFLLGLQCNLSLSRVI